MPNHPRPEEMLAISRTHDFQTALTRVPVPEVEPKHVVIKVSVCAVNPGDIAWIRGLLPVAPESMYDLCGVSGAGTVIEAGEGCEHLEGKNVAYYRSHKTSDRTVGTWCEYARLHHLTCVVLGDDANLEEYSGSIVNSITPYAFLEQVADEGHEGVVCTAGTSATGRAMLGICQAKGVPIISLVRNEPGSKALQALGGEHILCQDDADFDVKFNQLAAELGTTAVFENALTELGQLFEMPHFKTIKGRVFDKKHVSEALRCQTSSGSKAILDFS